MAIINNHWYSFIVYLNPIVHAEYMAYICLFQIIGVNMQMYKLDLHLTKTMLCFINTY